TDRHPSTFDLNRQSAEDYSRELVFRNDQAFAIAAVSPDGATAALVRPRTSADSDIFLLDLKTADAESELIKPHEGNVNHGVHEFTRDGSMLVYSTDEHGELQQAWTYDAGSVEQ